MNELIVFLLEIQRLAKFDEKQVRCYKDLLRVILQNIPQQIRPDHEQVQKIQRELSEQLGPDEKIDFSTSIPVFAKYFKHIHHLIDLLAFAPPEIQKYQLELMTDILNNLSPEEYNRQITSLEDFQLEQIISNALTHAADQYSYQALVQRCIFETIARKVKQFESLTEKNETTLQGFFRDLATYFKKMRPQTQMPAQNILDQLYLFEYNGKKITDLLEEASSFANVTKPTLDTLTAKRAVYQELGFGQTERYEYFQKLKQNLKSEYLWGAKTVRDMCVSDLSVSDYHFVNLTRQKEREQQHKKSKKAGNSKEIVQGIEIDIYQAPKTTPPSNLIDSSKYIGREWDFPFPNRGQIYESLSPSMDANAIRKTIEKIQIMKYQDSSVPGSPIKIAVRLCYISDEGIENFKEGRIKKAQLNESITKLTIVDTEDLDEACIQARISLREQERFKQYTSEKNHLKEALKIVTPLLQETTSTTIEELNRILSSNLEEKFPLNDKLKTSPSNIKIRTLLTDIPKNLTKEALTENIRKLEEFYQLKNQEILDMRRRIAAFRRNFPGTRIADLKLSPLQEDVLRIALECDALRIPIQQESRTKKGRMSAPDPFNPLEYAVSLQTKSAEALGQTKKLLETALETKLTDSEESTPIFQQLKKRHLAKKREAESCVKLDQIEGLLDSLVTTSNESDRNTAKGTLTELFQEAYSEALLKELNEELTDKEVTALKLKVDGDISHMIENISSIAKAVAKGKPFVSDEQILGYTQLIKSIEEQYNQKKQKTPTLPDFNEVSFKIKHNKTTKTQTISIFNQDNTPLCTVELSIPSLPYSLRKSSDSGYFLSYGGSRGVRTHKLVDDFSELLQKRLMTNVRLIGQGQYGHVTQGSNLFSLNELAFKHVVTGTGQDYVFDPMLASDPRHRDIFSRADNLSLSERIINRCFNEAINAPTPKQSQKQPLREHKKILDLSAEKVSSAQLLALGQSLADLSKSKRLGLHKEDLAYHNPLLRSGFDFKESLEDSISQADGMFKAIKDYHQVGFVHGDIKPENIMIQKLSSGRYIAALIDKATSAFEQEYKGDLKNLSDVANTVFPEIQSDKFEEIENGIKTPDGFYVIQKDGKIFFGKDAHLQITHGQSRNCTLPYIAPDLVKHNKTKDTIIQANNPQMDNWALTAMLFGICNKKAYFDLVKGRAAIDYSIPGVLEVKRDAQTQEEMLEISSPDKFKQLFECQPIESSIQDSPVMFIPANEREGEPAQLYRSLEKMHDELKSIQNPEQQTLATKIKDILTQVYEKISSGIGFSDDELQHILTEIDATKKQYLRFTNPAYTSQIDHEKDLKAALEKIRTGQTLSSFLDKSHPNLLEILCLYPQTQKEKQQVQELLTGRIAEIGNLLTKSIINDNLLQQMLAAHQTELLTFLLENDVIPEALIAKKQLLFQAAHENQADIFGKLLEKMDNKDLIFTRPEFSRESTNIKWQKNCLELAIDNGNEELVKKILSLAKPDHKQQILDALYLAALHKNVGLFNKILENYSQLSSKEILSSHQPLSSYHLLIMKPGFSDIPDDILSDFLFSTPYPAILACKHANVSGLSSLLEKAQDLNWAELFSQRDLNGEDILQSALQHNSIEDTANFFQQIALKSPESLISLLSKHPNSIHDYMQDANKKDADKLSLLQKLVTSSTAPEIQLMLLCSSQELLSRQEPKSKIFKDLHTTTKENLWALLSLDNQNFNLAEYGEEPTFDLLIQKPVSNTLEHATLEELAQLKQAILQRKKEKEPKESQDLAPFLEAIAKAERKLVLFRQGLNDETRSKQELQQELSNLRHQYQILQIELREKTTNLETLSSRLSLLQTSKGSFEDTIETLKARLQQLDSANKELSTQITAIGRENTELKTSQSTLTNENTALQTQNNSLAEERDRTTERNTEIESELTTLGSKFRRIQEELAAQTSTHSDEKQALVEQIRLLTEQIRTIESQNTELTDSQDRLTRENTDLQERKTTLTSENESLLARTPILESQLAVLRPELARLQEELESQTQEHKAQAVTKDQQIGELRAQIQDLQGKNTLLTTSIESITANMGADKAALQQERAALTQQVGTERQSLLARETELQAERLRIQAERTQAEERLAQEKARLHEENEEARRALEASQRQIQADRDALSQREAALRLGQERATPAEDDSGLGTPTHEEEILDRTSPSPQQSHVKFKLFARKNQLDRIPHNTDEILASINFEPTDIQEIEAFKSEAGAKVYTSQGQEYYFKYNPDTPDTPPKAMLMKSQIPTLSDTANEAEKEAHYMKLALTVMNMIENVLSKGQELHINTKNPFIAQIANLYISDIKDLDINGERLFENLTSSVSNPECDATVKDSAENIYTKIISRYYSISQGNIENMPWLKEAVALRTSRLRGPGSD